MKRHFLSLVLGTVITGMTMLVPFQYCMDGPGRGFPFAVYSPLCGAWCPVFTFDENKTPQVLDVGGLLADVLVWTVAVAVVRPRL